MSYLSRRMREIKAEETARKSGIKTTFINTVKTGQITAGIRLHVDFRNRGA